MIEVQLKGSNVDGNMAVTVDNATAGTTGFQTVTGVYIGGEPAGIGPSGVIFGGVTEMTDVAYVGVFYNNSIIDTDVGRGQVRGSTDLSLAQPAIINQGGFKARLWQGTRHSAPDARPPFLTGDTWVEGDSLYIDRTTGRWTNTQDSLPTHASAVIQAEAKGRVLATESSGTGLRLVCEFY